MRYIFLKRGALFKRALAFAVWAGLSFGFATGIFANVERVKGSVAKVSALQTALDCFEVDVGRYPSTAQGVSALIAPPSSGEIVNWRGPYTLEPEALRDRWGHAFVYRCPGVHNTNSYDLYSLGPDGLSMSGGEDPDDIRNWLLANGGPSALERIRAASAETLLVYVGVPLVLGVLVALMVGSSRRWFGKES